MHIGIPTEVKEGERRVALTPDAARELHRRGHTVLVQAGAGANAGFPDHSYRAAGAELRTSAQTLFEDAQLIVKVKEPQRSELPLLGSEHVLFTYLHLAADPALAHELAATGATCIGYETVIDQHGRLPLLAPMSEIAGRLAAHLGVHYLLVTEGGNGTIFGGIPGTQPARVTIIGAGTVGTHAAAVACGLGSRVTILDQSLDRLRTIDSLFQGRIDTHVATDAATERSLTNADVVIGAVLVHGAKAPQVIRREHLALIAPGGVLVDVSIDQGGCAETSRPTTHSNPIYTEAGVRHAAITNLPAAAAHTATHALTNASLPYLIRLTEAAISDVLAHDAELREAVNVTDGKITHRAVLSATTSAAAG